MKKIVTLFALFAWVSVAMAQSASKTRMDAIWDAADDRIGQQIELWFDGGDFPAAVSLLCVQFELDPTDYEVATNLGWMQENIHLWDDAAVTYDKFRKLNPTLPDRALPAADYYSRLKQFAKIPPLVEPVLNSVPHPHPNNYRVLAHAYEKLHRYEDAKRVYLLYIAVAPTDLAAKANLAKVEKKLASAK